jgi:hypothetical protein
MNNKSLFFIFLFSFLIVIGLGAQDSGSGASPFSLNGYIKEMPSVMINRDFSETQFSNMIHNRLNFRWNVASGLNFVAEGRNRLYYNSMLKVFPQFADLMGQDDGLIDLSWVWLSDGGWMGHSMVDRLYLDWQQGSWRIRAGRQRINWGINLVSNPNDLFNTYSFFDFDYPERPGADAIRVQYFGGDLSRVELAYSPAKEARESVAAMLYGFNVSNYDIQAIAGYFRHRAALGLGWAGHIGGAGFKGEGTWFYHLEDIPGRERSTLVAAIGADYMFAGGTFAVAEVLYNGGYQPLDGNFFMITQPLRPDNIMFSEFAITLSANHAFSPILNGGLSVMGLPDINAFFVSPNIKYSVATNLDLEFVAQIFAGGKGSIFEQAGSSWFMSLQYSF